MLILFSLLKSNAFDDYIRRGDWFIVVNQLGRFLLSTECSRLNLNCCRLVSGHWFYSGRCSLIDHNFCVQLAGHLNEGEWVLVYETGDTRSLFSGSYDFIINSITSRYPTQLANMSPGKILDPTAVIFFHLVFSRVRHPVVSVGLLLTLFSLPTPEGVVKPHNASRCVSSRKHEQRDYLLQGTTVPQNRLHFNFSWYLSARTRGSETTSRRSFTESTGSSWTIGHTFGKRSETSSSDSSTRRSVTTASVSRRLSRIRVYESKFCNGFCSGRFITGGFGRFLESV